ncbi:unconventional prefoldin RPB5 interactor-like protein [Plodia interpunctella]|uniref:unconventional prefoldin RPB5 interactor-like protein n=1 Tax=Plodia interpunctella TaxID=58824 RepID=UPI0023686A7A|nr:unconventional prefoldin RPB5 interactor-like protein [Plodia interpunctella]
MDIFNDAYQKCVAENEKNLRFWEEYANSLNSLDFSVFSEKLTVPALVPIGNRIFFRGQLKHTNEVTVSLGADYFVKCSLKQAEILKQHRLKGAQSKLEMYRKEKEYLQNQLSFTKENIYENLGKEIVEICTDKEDRVWREKHRENMRQYKLKSKMEPETTAPEVTDEELWERLEELELQEEFQNELSNMNDSDLNSQKNPINMFVVKEAGTPPPLKVDNNKNISKSDSKESKPPHETSKMNLLQHVLEKQNELEQKLYELKNKDRSQTKTEEELISKLDEMEELDELEDEMDRLEDILQTEDVESTDDEDSSSRQSPISKRGVTFVEDDDSETIDIVYKHSSVEPTTEPYDPTKGITKPSDIYVAYSNLFKETTSILKKTKYEDNKNVNVENTIDKKLIDDSILELHENNINKTIVVKDVVEKYDVNSNKFENTESRPISLFKKKRLQNK